MDQTKPPAGCAEAELADADPGEPVPEPSTCPGAAPAQLAEAAPQTGPDEADDDWVSL